MRDAGVLRLAPENGSEDSRTFELVGIGLVGGQSRGVEGQRVVDLRLVVVRVALCQCLHRLGVSLCAREMTEFVMVDIDEGKRVDVVALALGLGADTFSFAIAAVPSTDSLQASGRADLTTSSARSPNRQCRTRDRPSGHPQTPFAMRGTRTNADRACRDRRFFALRNCKTSRSEPCQVWNLPIVRKRMGRPSGLRRRLRQRPVGFSSRFSLSPIM